MPARPYALAALAALTALTTAAAVTGPATASVTTSAARPATAAAHGARLTNLAHLDFLGATVTPPATARHTTYRLAAEPAVGVLWTYADRTADGGFRRVGGGAFDPATNTYGQGAFNADDVARGAVVYLRDWRQTRSAASREHAYQLLRGLTFLQTATGPDAGNVVLWMQPDGTLNPSADPVELPDPSDSDASYWLARTVWALGEGYAAFARSDPRFAAFLGARLDLAVRALDRQVLVDAGRWDGSDGRRVPAWLVVDGADASAEAVLGLSAYVAAARPSPSLAAARTALRQLAAGIAAMGAAPATGPRTSSGQAAAVRNRTQFPYGAVLPWTHSTAFWHAWSSQQPAALARAAQVLRAPALLAPAVRDTGSFTPYLLTATGPVNGWTPTPDDLTQIAYGVDSRVQSLLAVADAARAPGLRAVAALTAGWYFGANRAGTPMYDPATGVTFDGLAADGTVNRNSGAESTIHGLLSMLALDDRPDVARTATALRGITTQDGVTVVQGEAAALEPAPGGATGAVVRPASAWTGESGWSAGAYLDLPAGASASWTVPAHAVPYLVQPVVRLEPVARAAAPTTRWDRLGAVTAVAGPQGVSEAPGLLQPVTLPQTLPAGRTDVRVTATAGSTAVDALLLRPLVSRLAVGGPTGGATLLVNADRRTRTAGVTVTTRSRVDVYDARGRLVRATSVAAGSRSVRVVAGGFTVVRP